MITMSFAFWMLAYPVELNRLALGQVVAINGKTYARCNDCKWVVRIDKPFFGSLHSCVPPEERAAQ
jgi:hypothetical protein